MAESLPVVTVPGDDEALGIDSLSPEDIVELHEVVVEELPMEEFEGFDSIDTTPFAVVTEPSELSGEVVIVIGSSGEEEGEEEVEVVERGAERRGMATQSGIHPVTVPSEMPIDDVPPDETIPAFPVEGETASEAQNATVVEVGDGDDDVRVLNVEKVVVVEEVEVVDLVKVVEVVDLVKEVEVVDLVKEVEVVNLVKEEVLTEEVTVKVSEVLLGKETVEEAMETEKGEKKRLREGEEEDEEAAKKLKSEEEEKAAKKRLRDGEEEEEEEAVKKLKSEEEEQDAKELKSEEEEQDAKKLKSEEEQQDAKKLKSEEEEAGKKSKSEEEEQGAKELKSEEGKVVEPKKLGPKIFSTPVEMFSYFYNLLHDWNLNQNVNKYEFMVLSELVSQGNPQKVGNGIAAIQVRQHPKWQSRCYYVIHEDGSEDDFSYRKCCDALMPLPASLYRKNGELNLEKLFPGQKGRHHREQQQQNGGGRGGGRGDYRGGRGGGGGRFGGRGGGGRGGRGGGGRRGGRGRW